MRTIVLLTLISVVCLSLSSCTYNELTPGLKIYLDDDEHASRRIAQLKADGIKIKRITPSSIIEGSLVLEVETR